MADDFDAVRQMSREIIQSTEPSRVWSIMDPRIPAAIDEYIKAKESGPVLSPERFARTLVYALGIDAQWRTIAKRIRVEMKARDNLKPPNAR